MLVIANRKEKKKTFEVEDIGILMSWLMDVAALKHKLIILIPIILANRKEKVEDIGTLMSWLMVM